MFRRALVVAIALFAISAAAAAREAPALMCVATLALAIICIVGGLALIPLREHLFGPAGEILLKGREALTMGVAP